MLLPGNPVHVLMLDGLGKDAKPSIIKGMFISGDREFSVVTALLGEQTHVFAIHNDYVVRASDSWREDKRQDFEDMMVGWDESDRDEYINKNSQRH